MESLDVQVIVGDGTRAEVLNSAGVSKADLVVVVTDADRTNMLACALASRLGAKRVILRLSDMRRLEGYHYFYKQALGFDVVLSTQDLVADEIVATVRENHALEVESFADGRVQVRRLRINAESGILEKPLKDLDLPRGVLVGGVTRGESFHVPTGSDELQSGDQLYLIGTAEDLDTFESLAGAKVLGRRSVVLMGAGGIGRGWGGLKRNPPGVSMVPKSICRTWIARAVWKPFACAEMPRMACTLTGRPIMCGWRRPAPSVHGTSSTISSSNAVCASSAAIRRMVDAEIPVCPATASGA